MRSILNYPRRFDSGARIVWDRIKKPSAAPACDANAQDRFNRRLFVSYLSILLFFTTLSAAAADEILYEQKLERYPFPIFLPAAIEGKTFIFELDTGAAMHFADSSLRPFMGPFRANRKVQSFGRPIDVECFDAPAITIGAWRMPPGAIGLNDMGHFRSSSGVDIRGYIGASALGECALSFDFDHKRMRILYGCNDATIGMQSLRLISNVGSPPRLECDIDGNAFEFLIDSGASNYIGLNHETFATLIAKGLVKTDGGRKGSADTAAGRVSKISGRFTGGQLFGVNLRETPVDETNATNIMGMGFLLNLNSVIDFRNLTFFYKRRETRPDFFEAILPDLSITFPGGHNYIHRITPGSSLAKAGFKVGDRIVRLGPLPESEINAYSIYILCVEHADKIVEIEVQHSGDDKPTLIKLRLPKREPRPSQ